MFIRLSKTGVGCSDGFEVEWVTASVVEYREGARVVTERVQENFMGKWPGVSIDPSAFARWDGSSEIHSSKKQAKMRANFVAVMSFLGIAVEP